GGLGQIWTNPERSPQWYPLVFTTFWVENQLWGKSPAGYHLVNLLLHALSAVLIWRLLHGLRLPGAWFAAALFAVHPVMVESVAWVTERKNVLSLALALAAAHLFFIWLRRLGDPRDLAALGSAETPARTRAPERGRAALALAGCFVCFVLALFSKTVVAALPPALLLLLWWRGARLFSLRALLPLLGMFAAGVAMGLFTAEQELEKVRATGVWFEHGFVERLLVAGRAVWFYLYKLLLPFDLQFLYPRWKPDPASILQWLFPVAAVVFVGSLWALRKRLGRGPLVAVLIFGGTLFPALGFFNVYPHKFSWVADHFQYHASVAMLALIAAALVRLPYLRSAGDPPLRDGPLPVRWPRATLAAVCAPLVVLAALSAEQSGMYKDQRTLWRQTLDDNPGAWLAANNLGVLAEDNPELAESYFRQGLAIEPDWNHGARHNLAILHMRRGEFAEAERLEREAVFIEPYYLQSWYNLGLICLQTRQFGKAVDAFAEAVDLWTSTPHPVLAPPLGMYGQYAIALSETGDFDGAEAAMRVELEHHGTAGQTRFNWARILATNGRTERAVAELESLLRVAPDYPSALVTLGWIRAAHQQALHRKPNVALGLAQKAAQGRNAGNPEMLDLLAAAYAATGDYTTAAEVAQRAAGIAAKAGLEPLAQAISRRLQLYRQGQPFRSPTGLAD
ncbi:MAG TPA: tetratricopeptide repeat protein, partial [Planctomycetota bacterium]